MKITLRFRIVYFNKITEKPVFIDLKLAQIFIKQIFNRPWLALWY